MKRFLIKIFLLCNMFSHGSTFTNLNIPINKKLYEHKYSIFMINNICPDYLEKFTKLLDQEQSENIVKDVTGFLTKVDSFGGYVLHTNDVIINCILNNDILPLEQKKSIILFFIELSQHGDATGSQILQFYHDLVNCLL